MSEFQHLSDNIEQSRLTANSQHSQLYNTSTIQIQTNNSINSEDISAKQQILQQKILISTFYQRKSILKVICIILVLLLSIGCIFQLYTHYQIWKNVIQTENTIQKILSTIKEQEQKDSNTNNKLDLIIEKYQQIVYFSKIDQFNHNNCPGIIGSFFVSLEDKLNQNSKIQGALRTRAQKCEIQILGIKQLQGLAQKWNNHTIKLNQKYNNNLKLNQKQNNNMKYQKDHNIIKDLQRFNSHNKKMLFVFLQLYFYAGTYLDYQIIFTHINNLCWKSAILEFDILFISVKKILTNGIKLPNFEKFIRTRYPYTPMIKKMIENIINHKEYDEQCQRRQCLIMICDQKDKIQYKQQIQQFKWNPNPRTQTFNYSTIISNQNNRDHIPIKFDGNKSYHIFPRLAWKESLDTTYHPEHQVRSIQWKNNTNQIFKFIPQDSTGRMFKIYNPSYKKVMKIQGNCQKASQVKFADEKGTNDQVWQFIPINQNVSNKKLYKINDNQYFFFIISYCGKVLNLQWPIDKDVTNIYLWDKNDYDGASMWCIYPIYHPQFEFATIQQYEQQYINTTYYQMAENSFTIRRKKRYLQERIIQKSGKMPFWMYFPVDETKYQTIDLPKKSHSIQCSKQYRIAYVWMGLKQMPPWNKETIRKCYNARLLNEMDWIYYSKLWDQLQDSQAHLINGWETPIVDKIDLLKQLYLYFQGGVYSDFDTQINEKCFSQIFTEELIFTNIRFFYYGQRIMPQQNFMKINNKYNPQVKLSIEYQIRTDDRDNRWKECFQRQCLVVRCQRHYNMQLWKK